MKKTGRITVITAVCLVICFVFSSCNESSLLKPVSELLSPPLFYEEYEDLLEAFYKNLGEKVSFCNPCDGEYKSAIVLEDLDSDGTSEAIIFYFDKSNETVARMHHFDYIANDWVSIGDFAGYGSEVSKIEIVDMDNDGDSELVVTWSTAGVAASNVLSVYKKMTIVAYREIANELCAMSIVEDIDSDGNKEILMISQNTSSSFPQRFASALKLSSGSVVFMDEIRIDGNISSYVSIKTEDATEKTPLMIYIDALKGEQQMITEVIYWDKNGSKLCAPLFDEATMSNISTIRYEKICCSDINNDGKIEIPIQSAAPSYEINHVENTENLYLTRWVNFTLSEQKMVANTYINYSDGYMIYLTNNEAKNLGIRNYRNQKCWVLYMMNSEEKIGSEIFSVLNIENKNISGSYIKVIEKGNSSICVYVTQAGKDSGLNEEYIKTKVVPIPN